MFLLGLASASGLSLPQHTMHQKCSTRCDSSLPSVSEDSFPEQYPFPQVMFRYLSQHGATAADSAFADDVIFRENSMARGLSKSGNFEGLELQLAEVVKQLAANESTAQEEQVSVSIVYICSVSHKSTQSTDWQEPVLDALVSSVCEVYM